MAAEGKGSSAARTAWDAGALIARRYRVLEMIGRGGSSSAYRVFDELTQSPLALKVLDCPAERAGLQALTENFEREFHTLKHLAHPRVVQARDYGITEGLPFFTLELLDGGDLQALSPLPWQVVCGVAYDIASALSLLHSRRLLHRDITPRNIRRTDDGKAKLFDFGLLSPMGTPNNISGTPPYVAPELVQRSALDARSDIYALGVTLYYALTGRVCFPARSFAELRDLWRSNPPAPSRFVPEIPAPLDDLILAMIRLDAASRPRSAAEVMDRLRPLLASPPDEELSAASSYLASPRLFGRESVILQFRQMLLQSVRGRGGGFLIESLAGMGRTRLLDAFVLEAKLLGATTLRANPRAEGTKPFASASALARELLGARPDTAERLLRAGPAVSALFRERTGRAGAREIELLPLDRADADPLQLHNQLCEWLLEAARTQLLVIAVDDFEQIDEASAALLAVLVHAGPQHRLVYAFSATSQVRNETSTALEVLSERATRIELGPLSAEETRALLASVFGDAPHLQLLSRTLHEVSGGRPRDCMLLAQHLVDRDVIRYADGIWSLPIELPAGVLPRNMEESLERRIAALSPIARRTCLALAATIFGRLSRAQLTRLEAGRAAEMDEVLDELRASQLVVGAAAGYGLCDPSLVRLLASQLSAEVHAALAELHTQERESPVAIAYHLIHAQQSEAGILQLMAALADPLARMREVNRAESALGTDRTASTYALILGEAERLGRPLAELQMWRAMLVGMCARGADPQLYYRIADTWLAGLKRDCGYLDWLALSEQADPLERARLAISRASERHADAPAHERGMPPSEALRHLIGYVLMSIAISVRGLDLARQRTLPGLLEPFAPLSRLVEAMLWNARATCLNGEGKREKARELFVIVLQRMESLSAADLPYLDKVRAAITQTLCEIDSSLGVDSSYLAELDTPGSDPNQRVSAHYIRKVVALNRGEWDAAERHRLDAELLSVQLRSRSMFTTLAQELEAHALARDLTGVKQVRARIGLMASGHPGWRPVLGLADAHYARLCGDLDGALEAAAAVVEEARLLGSPWTMQARAVQIELLVELRRPDAAIEIGQDALAKCLHEDMAYLARGLSCALTLAEAALGHYQQALKRIRLVIAELLGLGVSGLQLGRAYECSARVAIAMHDSEAFSEDAARVEEQYRRGSNSVLGALYERLLEDARRSGGSLDPMMSYSDVTPAADSEALTTQMDTMLVDYDQRKQPA